MQKINFKEKIAELQEKIKQKEAEHEKLYEVEQAVARPIRDLESKVMNMLRELRKDLTTTQRDAYTNCYGELSTLKSELAGLIKKDPRPMEVYEVGYEGHFYTEHNLKIKGRKYCMNCVRPLGNYYSRCHTCGFAIHCARGSLCPTFKVPVYRNKELAEIELCRLCAEEH